MSRDSFRALIVDQVDGQPRAAVREAGQEELPAGDVLISVVYSCLNYKDGLAVTGQGKVIRSYPMVPGIDLAGTVVESGSPDFKPGDEVIVTGWGVGESHWGGFAQLARMQAGWLVPLPEGLTMRQAMAIGTAGFTAMLSVMALEERGLTPEAGEVIVTGASGGVGSIAVAILARLGYHVVGSTGRTELHDYLRKLGARDIIDRSELAEPPSRPMVSGRWAGAIDVVGSHTLASLLAAMTPNSSIAVCGLAGGSDLQTTVFPLILRGVSLLGINSVLVPQAQRLQAWRRLAQDLPQDTLEMMTQVAPLDEVITLSQQIIKGEVQGRIVVDLNA
jgi:acrylyl-CoA reductase (NADPH)